MVQHKQHLDSLRQKDSLRGVEATEISVYLGNYSASHFEGSALIPLRPALPGRTDFPIPPRAVGGAPLSSPQV